MIQCYINNTPGYPDIQSEIKVTKENPFVANGDSFTMDVNFPMSIPENAALFGNLHRMDVSKRIQVFDDCQLYADNLLLIRGSGRVTEVTETTVKLQILGGYNNIRYQSAFQKVFIDRIDNYPRVADKYRPRNVYNKWWDNIAISGVWVEDEVAQKGYVGDKYSYVFQPIYDATNGLIANHCMRCEGVGKTGQLLTNAAVQPNLMMVLRKVLEYMGYTISLNEFDCAPWNEMVIASARQTLNIAYALPHWTVDRLLDEIRNLFNASFVFDDSRKSVRIVRNNEMNASNDVAYDVVEEFKTNYDEDGIQYVGGSNLKYLLDGDDRTLDDFPADLMRNFPVRDYDSFIEMMRDFESMTEKECFTTIFHCPQGFFFYGHKYDAEGMDTGQYTLQRFGMFSPLYRNLDTDSFLELRMYPVQMKYDFFDFFWVSVPVLLPEKHEMKARAWLPVVNNDKGNEYIDYDEKGYVSVSNVLEDGDSSTTEEEEDSTGIALMWVGEYAHPIDDDALKKVPSSFTDMRNSYLISSILPWSMCLVDPYDNEHYIGELHRGSLQIESTVDVNNEICYQFLCDGIPDPSAVYNFRNKRYLCSKVEIRVTADGIDRLKTGYFHEIKL